MISKLGLETVREAATQIRPYVVRTPLLRVEWGDVELLLKPESLQATGAFKLRGAFNKMLRLPPDCPGVVAHSSGNHAQASKASSNKSLTSRTAFLNAVTSTGSSQTSASL